MFDIFFEDLPKWVAIVLKWLMAAALSQAFLWLTVFFSTYWIKMIVAVLNGG